ncbi:Lsr2 family DNA-binding protein [Aeromicrobium alkaliterrae]|uniref:Lsr2 family DNA-binding protein n=1 Tax=Aeromicrobium alkaliterrae TaxID=302168 RepID=UPI0031E1EAF1
MTEPSANSSPYAQVRRWAKLNGYDVGVRGRIARTVLDAYNEANQANVVDHSGRRPRKSMLMEEIESLRLPRVARRANITVTVFVVDEDGTQHPYAPGMLKRFEPPTYVGPPVDRPGPKVRRFVWPS